MILAYYRLQAYCCLIGDIRLMIVAACHYIASLSDRGDLCGVDSAQYLCAPQVYTRRRTVAVPVSLSESWR